MRNAESHFSLAPQVEVRRSKFRRPCRTLTTFNAGDLVPIYLDEVLPGDTFKINLSKVVRQTTAIHPTMDNAYLDTYFFYVPTRIIWKYWEEFNGANKSPWKRSSEYQIPQLNVQVRSVGGNPIYNQKGSVLDYLGVPTDIASTGGNGISISILPLNAYCKIWNDWFRDENTQSEAPIAFDAISPSGSGTYVLQSGYPAVDQPGSCLKANKFHDYFTSCLPGPQKHADVLIPMTNNNVTVATTLGSSNRPYFTNLASPTNSTISTTTSNTIVNSGNQVLYFNPNGSLVVNLDLTVNNLRLAVQTQKLFERDALGGTRYIEILKAHFGVTSPDARLQRSEYLGGKRISLNMQEVTQTSETSTTALGSLAGKGLTADVEDGFTKSFVEHGYILGLAVVRCEQSYSQGLNKLWTRKNRLDFYWPVLSNIGEQPVKRYEIYLDDDGTTGNGATVFGYQEAWAEYRYKPNQITGYFRNGSGTLNSWHYGTNFNAAPTLAPSFLVQGVNEIDRTLAVQSNTMHQYIGDFYFNVVCVRPMPLYSIPGFVDHF